MLDFSVSRWGGRYLLRSELGWWGKRAMGALPWLALHELEADELDEDADEDLAEEWGEHFSGHEAGGGLLLAEHGVGAGPAHW